MQLVFIELDEN